MVSVAFSFGKEVGVELEVDEKGNIAGRIVLAKVGGKKIVIPITASILDLAIAIKMMAEIIGDAHSKTLLVFIEESLENKKKR